MADSAWPALMAAAQSGDSASYRRLLGELKPWLKRYNVRRLPVAVVDDAVRDASSSTKRSAAEGVER